MSARNKKSSAESPVSGPAGICSGVWPVMLTPFDEAGGIDWAALDALIDWYEDAGVAGLFAVCLSSEMYHLSVDERRQLARHIVDRANSPVVTAGAFGDSIAEQAEAVYALAETGVNAVVLAVNQLAAEDESDAVWRDQASELLAKTAQVPLGLYECPAPYHRLLTPALLAWAAETGRFYFLKDTCCDRAAFRVRIAAVQGTPLRGFNAHSPSLLASLQAGGHGYSGIAANAAPALCAQLCEAAGTDPERATRLQAALNDVHAALGSAYPAVAKAFLARRGLPWRITCRGDTAVPIAGEVARLEAAVASADNLLR